VGVVGVEELKRLIKALKNKDKDVRWGAAKALVKMGPKAVPALIKALEDEEWEVRRAVVQALGKIGPGAEKAVPALIEALKDEDQWVCSYAAQALGKVDCEAEKAVPALTVALKDKDKDVRINAAYALKEIGPRQRKQFQPLFKLSKTRMITSALLQGLPSKRSKRNNRQTAALLHGDRSRPDASHDAAMASIPFVGKLEQILRRLHPVLPMLPDSNPQDKDKTKKEIQRDEKLVRDLLNGHKGLLNRRLLKVKVLGAARPALIVERGEPCPRDLSSRSSTCEQLFDVVSRFRISDFTSPLCLLLPQSSPHSLRSDEVNPENMTHPTVSVVFGYTIGKERTFAIEAHANGLR
jgi:hypothetical protein